jgi:hypothetical protein
MLLLRLKALEHPDDEAHERQDQENNPDDEPLG